uniref:Uncharacterized protein n=1 Tax=Graphocephala atropunctata TaxID=36148 RepID=A0A1B6KNC0_9HEMI
MKNKNISTTQASETLTRQSRAPKKEASADSNFKVLKRNKNFQPESKVSIIPRSSYSAAASRVSNASDSYTVVPKVCGEVSEDMYLRRRLPKSPVRKNMSKL